MTLLTIFNTLALAYLLYQNIALKHYINFRAVRTFWFNRFCGFEIALFKRIDSSSSRSVFVKHVLFKNKKDADMKDRADYMLSIMPNTNTQNQLMRIFSWIETDKDAKRFQKHFSKVDKGLVDSLVEGFKAKNKESKC